jgi:rare lipoprotein A
MAEWIYRTLKVREKDFTQKYIYSGSGQASYYNEGFAGKSTASGEIYNPQDMTAAHRTLPFGTRLRVTHEGQSVVVRVNDRGPYHEKRILDLSEKAFSLLAPISRGVISVEFEVYSAPTDNRVSVPEYVRPGLSNASKNPVVPTAVAAETVLGSSIESAADKALPPVPYFLGTVAHLSTDFFPNVELRRTIPQKIPLGTVIHFSGRALTGHYDEITVFLQEIVTSGGIPEQQHFSSVVSGQNFSFPVMFLKPGKFQIGLVFDDEKNSRVETIEVVNEKSSRRFSASESAFSTLLGVHVIPENQKIRFDWESTPGRVTRLVFSQAEEEKILLVEDGLGEVEVPYDFFDDFEVETSLAIDVFQALSVDGTIAKQTTNWKKAAFENFQLVRGFPDSETSLISVYNFPRFVRTQEALVLNGKVLGQGIQLPETAFLITPEGFVEPLIINKVGGDQFLISFAPASFGTHIFEIVSDQGQILFNRAIYVSQASVLPVADWYQTEPRTLSIAGIRSWVNSLRQAHSLRALNGSGELDVVAQQYANQMALEDFVSHTSPTGVTFEQRVKGAGLVGEYGENLSYATDFALALAGLENSASHRQNLLQTKWGRVGIGLGYNDENEVFIVQIFGK